MYAAQKYCAESTPLTRDVRIVFNKAGLQIGRLNNIIARQQAQIDKLQAQVGLSKPHKKRKKVVPEPNQRFATIDNIKAAQALAQLQEAATTSKSGGKAAEKAPAEAAVFEMESMCIEFQLHPVQ
ncbi:hypothetical protein DM02DRAFT_620140 [Periconia macrospinosa]|uniref:Uncharacterized protein n=1 Tax=Periconia macrospinosa TaxID=97972 RepID=A0A2V1D269_9PLEO|nr:hypothetical protein DM02DRAFT_620140 [Periconia macrospinosa]